MKLQSHLISTAVACHSSQIPLALSLEIGDTLGFRQSNYSNQSPATANGLTTKYDYSQEPPDSFSDITQGARAKETGGGGSYKHGKGDQAGDDDKCCACTCFDHIDKHGRYDKTHQDGNDYCHCTCSCGSGSTMPLIPTVAPPTMPPIEPTPSPAQPTPSPLVPTPLPTLPPTPSPTRSSPSPIIPTLSPIQPTPSPVVPTPLPTAPPTPSPTDSPTSSPTASPTVSPTGSPTASPDVCELPEPPLAEEDYEIFDNVTECGLGNQTITANNTLIHLIDTITCDFTGSNSFFLRIVGHNNTVDCGGYTIIHTGVGSITDGFQFNGLGNILQNCQNITGFGQDAVQADMGSSLFVRNITADGNDFGLFLFQAEAYVMDSEFLNSIVLGLNVQGSNSDPFRLVLKGSAVTNNGENGAVLTGPGEACLEDNVISQNDVNNVLISRDRRNGIPNVTLADNDFCDNLNNTDILDNTNVTTVLDNVQCETASFSSTVELNTTEYGCVPCTSQV